jgi:fatty-acyl-CoA synthase
MPQQPVMISGDDATSYAELAERAGRVAAWLRGRGVRRNDRVGLLSVNRPEWLEVYFGAAALGAVLAPFSTWSTAAELEFLLQDAGVSNLFTQTSYRGQEFAADVAAMQSAGKLPALRRVVCLDRPDYIACRETAPLGDLAPGEGASAGDPLVILYTSGSSSRPKCVPLSHYAAIENGFNIGERMGLTADDRVMISIPLFWSYGAVNALMAAMSHGATLVLQERFEPGEALDLVERHRCTAFYTLPAMTSALLAHPDFAPKRTASLRTGVTIGAPQDIVRAAEELGMAEICNVYGQTESYGNCCVTPHDWPIEKRAKCQGPPLPGVTIRIRDPETGADLAPGEVGEVLVKGYLTPGYAGASASANAEAFSEDGFFRTGDLGSLDIDGNLVFAGRISEMIKRSGINVSPAEVEEALQRSPAVDLAGVTGVEDAVKGEIIVAFIVARPGSDPTSESLRRHCRELLSGYKVPDRIFFRGDLPLTPTGKLMRRELRALATAAVAAEPVET